MLIARQWKITSTYQQDGTVGITGTWHVPRANLSGYESVDMVLQPTKRVAEPMLYNSKGQSFISELFNAVLEPRKDSILATVIYTLTPQALTPGTFPTEFIVYVQWNHDQDGNVPPTPDPTKIEFNINPIRGVKNLGKAFIQTNFANPPQYSVIIVQRALISIIDAMPEFEIKCTFAISSGGEVNGNSYIHGLIAAHCAVTTVEMR